jgi:acyl dehydratase
MEARYFEDWNVGDEAETGAVEVTREAAIAFAQAYDPQAFHLDDDAARDSIFGRLSASGWQTASLAMRAIVTSGVFPPKGLVGLGVDKLRWVKPVYPGDSLRVLTRVTSKRENGNKPTGIVQFENETRNQHGELVMTHETMVLMPRRPQP